MGEQRRKGKVSKRQNAKAETLNLLLLEKWEIKKKSRLQTNSMRDHSQDSKPSVEEAQTPEC